MTQPPPTPYLNDSWTPSVQDLGYENLRDQLVLLAKNSEPPFAAAVCGGWGSGKTSLLRAVMNQLGGELIQLTPEERLAETQEVSKFIFDRWEEERKKKEDPNIRCVWFNPWQHQFEGHPLIALLHEIRKQFSWRLKSKKKAGKLAYVSLKNGLRLLDDLTATVSNALVGHKVQIGVDKIEASGVAYEKERFMNKLDSQRFQLHFETAVAHLISDTKTANKEGRLVIFVDDLDRCNSDKVLHLLEAIKLYLSTPRCIFLFGLDTEHTEEALVCMGLKEHQARQYLHKLFQLTLRLPRSRGFEAFITQQILTLNQQGDDGPVFEFGKTKDKDGRSEPAQLAHLLTEILEGNPRRVKNFLNLLFFRGRIFKERHKRSADPMVLALLCGLQFHYPKVYRYLEEDPQNLNLILAGLNAPHPNQSKHGLEGFVARRTHLPQYEEANPDSGKPLSLLEGDHPTDSHALFVVRYKFKEKFKEKFTNYLPPSKDQSKDDPKLKLLKEYLEP